MPLEIPDARSFSRRGRAIVVALAGMKECGKTSLLARLHQMFLSGPVAGLDFAGGRSLPRFEELNWFATMESRVARPKMPRSSTQFDNSFLHIAVRPVGASMPLDLLLNDISGETFKNAVGARAVCEKLLALARADHVVILLDGAALADKNRRHLHVSHVTDFLEQILQTGQCGGCTAAHLVISKMDELQGNVALAESAERSILEEFNGKFGSFSCWRIAARPTDNSLPTIEPINSLFSYWVHKTHRYQESQLPSVPRDYWTRDFCKYEG